MPYLHCTRCRLTLAAGREAVPDDCPRCGGPLSRTPRRFFRRPDTPPLASTPPSAVSANVVRRD